MEGTGVGRHGLCIYSLLLGPWCVTVFLPKVTKLNRDRLVIGCTQSKVRRNEGYVIDSLRRQGLVLPLNDDPDLDPPRNYLHALQGRFVWHAGPRIDEPSPANSPLATASVPGTGLALLIARPPLALSKLPLGLGSPDTRLCGSGA